MVGVSVGVGVAVSGRGVVESAVGIMVGASVGVLGVGVGLGADAHDATRMAASKRVKYRMDLMIHLKWMCQKRK